MYIASQKRKENIAEYLLYMWQVEDIIRANSFDMGKIRATVIDRFQSLTEEQREQMAGWYESFIDMMRREGVETSGHLQINKNTLSSLAELHSALLHDSRFGDYSKAFYDALPFIVELRSKQGAEKSGEIETCFNALYAIILMRLQGRQIAPETQSAIKQISHLIALLAGYFHRNEAEDIFKTDD